MEIAPNYRGAQWKRLTFKQEDDWLTAASVFRRRIEGRFLKPARSLLRFPNAGFALMALDCLLIETLEQFRNGVKETPWGQGREYFQDFLTRGTFGAHFDRSKAGLFYTSIRCGILHQAELKGSSLLRKGRRFPLLREMPDGKGLEINRSRFHGALEVEFNRYLREIETPGSALREPFRRKMNFIARA